MSAVSHPTHVVHTLPPFSQAFNNSRPENTILSENNTLPPIKARDQRHSPPQRVEQPAEPARSRHSSTDNTSEPMAGRKRTRAETTTNDADADRTDSPSYRVRVKEDENDDHLDHESPTSQPPDQDYAGAPPPSSLTPSLKKRRTTISGAPHPLNTQLAQQPDHSGSTPISPVVRGFAMRDDAASMEQVRSMISVKKNQKALIEQRRGSVPMLSGIVSEDRNSNPSKPPPTSRRSPNGANNPGPSRRLHAPSSPPPSHQQPGAPVAIPPGSSLPPPPISFTHRRAGQIGALKRKPADILISPRDTHTPEQLQPEIQSAPPIPHAGQQRFAMAIPRLPSVLGAGGDSMRRVVSGHVPPTPTRLSRTTYTAPSSQLSQCTVPGTGRSPPTVPIATSLVPPTPSFLTQAAPAHGDKAAFLAPFEIFYDALNDSRQLKIWLTEQIQKSNTLMQSLTRQQEKLDETVETLVDKRTSIMRNEIAGLHRRVEELEDTLRATGSSSRRPSLEGIPPPGLKLKNKSSIRNGVLSGAPPGLAVPESSYTFPPQSTDSRRRMDRRTASPGWVAERDRDYDSQDPATAPSPAAYDSRRLSMSAIRMDPPRTDSREREPPPPPNSAPQKSPRPQVYRELSGPSHGSPRGSERPQLLRKLSSTRLHARNEPGEGAGAGGRQPERERGTPPQRHASVRSPEQHGSSMDTTQ